MSKIDVKMIGREIDKRETAKDRNGWQDFVSSMVLKAKQTKKKTLIHTYVYLLYIIYFGINGVKILTFGWWVFIL